MFSSGPVLFEGRRRTVATFTLRVGGSGDCSSRMSSHQIVAPLALCSHSWTPAADAFLGADAATVIRVQSPSVEVSHAYSGWPVFRALSQRPLAPAVLPPDIASAPGPPRE
jgi:hypothetical protein